MHFSTVVLFGGFAASAMAACAADNCLRAIRASAFPNRPGTADCSSYFLTTVSPATVTSTVYPTETVYANKKKRAPTPVDVTTPPTTIIPTAIPVYASPCSGAARYSSACSCIGVTPSITILSTPSTTVTAAVTATVAVTRPSVNFVGYSNEVCTGSNLGPDAFVQGECNPFFFPDSLALGGVTPGSCTKTSSCYIDFYNSLDCGNAFVGSVPFFLLNTCHVTDNSLSGILVCPEC